jgi:hypothetical protein
MKEIVGVAVVERDRGSTSRQYTLLQASHRFFKR